MLPASKDNKCETIISKKRSLEAAATYAKDGKRVCVINFASAKRPGGGVTHACDTKWYFTTWH